MISCLKFEDEKKLIIEGITEIPTKMRFSVFDRVWTSVDGETTYDVYSNSKEGQSADARFSAMSTCKMNAYFLEPLYSGYEAAADDDDAVLEIYGCTLNDGQDMGDVQDAEEKWQKQNTAMASKITAYRWDNFKTISQYDLVYLVVNDDLASFGANTTAWLTTDATQAVDAEFASVMRCDSAVLASQVVHRPKPTE